MRQGPKAQQIRSITGRAAEQEVISKIICQGLMKAVLTLWAGRTWESTGQRALNRTRIAPGAPRGPLLAAIEICALRSHPKVSSAARRGVVCLGAAFLF
jgi:hypothetical protein